MRAKWVAVAIVVILAAAGLAWWLWPSAPAGAGEGDAQGNGTATVSGAQAFSSELVKPRSHGEGEVHDAGFLSVDGEVYGPDGEPAAGVVVEAWAAEPADELECSGCGLQVFDCTFADTVKKLLEGLRSGALRPAKAIAQTTTDAQGNFHFDSLPGDFTLIAARGAQRGDASFLDTNETGLITITLREPTDASVTVEDPRGLPIAGARVTMYSPATRELQETTTDAQGLAKFRSIAWEDAWVAAEASGMLAAAGRGVLGADGPGVLILAPPKTLVVKTVSGASPVDSDVKLFLHGDQRTLRTKGGELRLEQIPYGTYDIEVSDEKLAAPRQSVELAEDVTVVTFDLRRSARLLVATVSASGEPVPNVSAELSGNEFYANASMSEEGEVLTIGPVPEGEYQLDVQAPGFRPVSRSIDLTPGDRTLEVVMREASKLRGRVVTSDGQKAPYDTQLTITSPGFSQVYARLEDGGFEADVPADGEWIVSARHPDHGAASVTIEVPAPDQVLRLASRGQVEVEVRDADGAVSAQEVSLQNVATGETVYAVPRDDGVSRVAGLEPGAYDLVLAVPQRVPIERKIDVADGRTTRVRLQLEKGAAISGLVLDEKGAPAAAATVIAAEHSITTGEDGRFDLEGLTPGETVLVALLPSGGETPQLKVTAPAHDVVLRGAEAKVVTGRVVDERGRVITSFTANATAVSSAEGRFSVPLQGGYLTVWAEGFTTFEKELSNAGDVGDVVLKNLPVIEGEVVDPEGRLVAGARVMLAAEGSETTTNASGRFKLIVDTGREVSEPLELLAVRGSLFGRATATRNYARIELTRGTHVVGRVIDAQGRPVQTEVKLESRTLARPMSVESDGRGAFEIDVAPGPWMIGTRLSGVARTYDVRGERFEVTLGAQAGTCGLLLRAQAFESAWLIPGGVQLSADGSPWDQAGRVEGILEIPGGRPGFPSRVRGVPCGDYELLVAFAYGERRMRVSLSGAETLVEVAAPEVQSEDGGTLLIVH